jgi:hypothetical protein
MSYTCKAKDGNIYNLQLLYIQRAYLPAITVCNQSLFKQTFVPTAPLPSVTNFVLESNGLVASFSWTPNATYTTYSEYKIDSGEWISLDDYAVNSDHSFFNFTEIATIGQSIYIRLRFGNGVNYGAWNEEFVVTTPFVLFYGNTLPDLYDFLVGIGYSSEPTLSLSVNNVIIDHPEYVTSFFSYQTYDGQFNFTACSNIDDIQIGVNGGADVSGCGNLILFSMNENTGEFDIDFTGCTSLISITIYNSNITNTDFLDTLPDKSLVSSIALFDNNITTVDFTDFTNLGSLDLSNNSITNIDFLDTISNKSFLQELYIYNNDITTADFTDFTNIYLLEISNNANLSSLILNSSVLSDISANETALTSLDLSSSLMYNNIRLSDCNISTLIIANGTANDNSKSIYEINNNNLSTESLDAFFTALGSATLNKKSKKAPPSINVQNNPGSATCDPTIATAKGWGVYTGF